MFSVADRQEMWAKTTSFKRAAAAETHAESDKCWGGVGPALIAGGAVRRPLWKGLVVSPESYTWDSCVWPRTSWVFSRGTGSRGWNRNLPTMFVHMVCSQRPRGGSSQMPVCSGIDKQVSCAPKCSGIVSFKKEWCSGLQREWIRKVLNQVKSARHKRTCSAYVKYLE